jgi:hypothetical protein
MSRMVTSNYRYTRPPRKTLAGRHGRDSKVEGGADGGGLCLRAPDLAPHASQ